PAQWKALKLRDRHCRFPGCRRPWNWCDAHHLDWWWDQHGPTDHNRMLLLCRHHHTLIHQAGWHLLGPPHHLTVIRPDGTELPTRSPP
ncbi:MAG TPA: HNH endonuclease, partial [Acidimicrobiia bacterium]|nr:HNH endonuclease [Acidimicrobiia bacterium]